MVYQSEWQFHRPDQHVGCAYRIPCSYISEPAERNHNRTGRALWFTEQSGNNLGRITTAGAITEFPMPRAGSDPWSIVSGPSGALWLTELGNRIGEAVFVTAGLSVTPGSAPFGRSLTFTGSAFAPNEAVTIYQAGIGSPVLIGGTADSSGSFTATAPNPAAQYGPRIFLGVGQSSGRLGAASLSIVPRLTLDPSSGPPGGTLAAVGSGFGATEQVDEFWAGKRLPQGLGVAGLDGGFNFNVTIPPNAPAGTHTMTAIGETSGARASEVVTVQ